MTRYAPTRSLVNSTPDFPNGLTVSLGNVGIGTTIPSYTLEVSLATAAASTTSARLVDSAAVTGESVNYLRVEKGAGYGGALGGYLSQGVGSGLIFSTLNSATLTERMRITSAGNVGIGTSSPTKALSFGHGAIQDVYIDRPDAATGTITLSGTTLTVVSTTTGAWAVGQIVYGGAITYPNVVTITALIPTTGGTGGNGTYTVAQSISQTISTATAVGANLPNTSLILMGGPSVTNSAAVIVRGPTGTYNTGGFEIYTNGAERVRILPTGKVGIGTNSPTSTLSSADGINIHATYGAYLVNSYYENSWKYVGNGLAWGIGNNFNGVGSGVTIATAAVNASGAGAALTWTPTLNIGTNGNVGIGTASPFTLLHIYGGTVTGMNSQLHISPASGGLGRESAIVFGATFSNLWGGSDTATRYSGAISYGAYYATTNPRSWSMKFKTGDDSYGQDTPTERMRLSATTHSAPGTTLRIGGIVSSYYGPNYTGINQEVNRHSITFASWRDAFQDTLGAKIEAINYTALNSADNYHLVQSTDLVFFTLGDWPNSTDQTTERMRIKSNGYVGINQPSPGAYLHASSSTTNVNAASFNHSGAGTFDSALTINNNNTSCAVAGGMLRMYAANSSASNAFMVLVNTTGEAFKVAGNGQITSLYSWAFQVTASTRAVYLDSSGNLGTLASMRASKTDIVPLPSSSWVNQLNPVSFRYRTKDDDGNFTDQAEGITYHGLIAEEVEQIIPELCYYDEKEDAPKKLVGVAYERFIPSLIKAIQELTARIATLEQRA